MSGELIRDLAVILPELVLAGGALALLVLGAALGEKSARLIATLGMLLLALALVITVTGSGAATPAFHGLFISDAFGRFMSALVLIGGIAAIPLGLDFFRRAGGERFEYTVLVILSTIGMQLMIGASNLIVLYVGLELQSLALYVLASFLRDDARSTEAGLKYFVLGALSSGMLLYGSSLVYGFTGTTSFAALAQLLSAAGPAGVSIGLLIGIVFVTAGIAFKVSAVPFHMWTPDVYEGSPTPVTAFFASAPKVAAMALFLRVLITPFGPVFAQWQQIVVFISLASMLLGAFAAINQTSFKRLMAYSSIGHVGYALLGLAAGGGEGVRGVLFYMAIYLITTLGTFGVLLLLRRDGKPVEAISDFSGLYRRHPWVAFVLALFMFSLAGVPPAAGFLAKFYVFNAAMAAGLTKVAVVGVLASVVSAFYYLRIVKIMYFDEAQATIETPFPFGVRLITTLAGLVTIVVFIIPAPLVNAAQVAAKALLP